MTLCAVNPGRETGELRTCTVHVSSLALTLNPSSVKLEECVKLGSNSIDLIKIFLLTNTGPVYRDCAVTKLNCMSQVFYLYHAAM